MKQLTDKHIARRLPYKVKAMNTFKQIVEILGIQNGNESVGNTLWLFKHSNGDYLKGYLYECNPILRPHSGLTKPITHKGETFTPMNALYLLNKGYEGVRWDWICETIESNKNAMQVLPNWIIGKLLEWHFVLDEPEGTWIDVNSLSENPYK